MNLIIVCALGTLLLSPRRRLLLQTLFLFSFTHCFVLFMQLLIKTCIMARCETSYMLLLAVAVVVAVRISGEASNQESKESLTRMGPRYAHEKAMRV